MNNRASLVLVLALSGALLGERVQATTSLPCPAIGAQPRSSPTLQTQSDHFCEDWSGVSGALVVPDSYGWLVGMNLGSASLRGAAIDAGIAQSNLENSDLRDAVIEGSLADSNLRSADLSRIQLGGVDFSGNDMSNAVVRDAELSGTYIGVNSILLQTDFSGSNLMNVDFLGARLERTNFSGANLTGVRWFNTDLRDSLFTGAVGFGTGGVFSFAILSGMDLRGIDFVNTYLDDADLRGADLSGATFSGTQFTGADLRGARLLGADLSSGPYGFTLNDAIFDDTTLYDTQTIFPAGFDPVAYGLTFVPEPGTALLVLSGLAAISARRRHRAY